MANNLRPTGIDVLGDLPWGTHFCQFYETQQDLLDIVVPYFKTGLEHQEFCLWIVPDQALAEAGLQALRAALPGLDDLKVKGRLEIVVQDNSLLQDTPFNRKDPQNPWHQRLRFWERKLEQTRTEGGSGMRGCEVASGLGKANREALLQFEKTLEALMTRQPALALCACDIENANAHVILDYANEHERIIAKRKGHWEILESNQTRQLKEELQKQNEALEERVAERTAQLQASLAKLQEEMEERRKAEQQSRRAEELAVQVVDTFPGTFVLLDENFRILRWNHNFEASRGYTPDEIRRLHAVNDFITEKDRPEITAYLKKAFTTGTASTEMISHNKDGSTRTLFYNARRIDYEGRPCVIACGVDVSRLKNAETMLRNLIEQSILGVYIIDEGKFTYVNPGLAAIFGYEPEELMSNPEVLRLIHPDDRQMVGENIRVRVAGEKDSVHYETRAIRKDGAEIDIEVYCKGCLHEQPTAIMGIVLDITERKRAENELQLAYQRLSYHVENNPLAVIEWDKDQCITRWSRRAEEIFGWTASEVLGTPCYTRPSIYEDDIETVKRSTDQLLNGGADSNVSENRNYTKDGRVIHCRWYNSVLRDEEGNITAHLSLVQDITTRKNVEAAVQHSYEEIRRLSQHLQDIREEERAHIAREIHDELGQQLTVLKMDVAWLGKKLSDADAPIKEKLRDLLELLDGTVQSVRRISSELRPSLLDDLGLAAAMEWHLKEFEKRSGIRTSLAVPRSELVLPDEIKTGLFRIFQESLTNVARHAGATRVQVALRRTNGDLLLSIEDNGKGFDKETLAQVKTLGVLGMKERALKMAGHYEIDSAPGKGTVVTVQVPAPKASVKGQVLRNGTKSNGH